MLMRRSASGTNSIDYLIVELPQFPMVNINTVRDISEETHSRIGQDFVEDADHHLDGLVIWRNTVADQSERGGEAVEDINSQNDIGFLEKSFSGIEPGWASTNNGNA
jgi:hypothetical protein